MRKDTHIGCLLEVLEAVENAVKDASKAIRNMRGVDILSWTGQIDGD